MVRAMSVFTKSLLTLFSAFLLIGCAATKTFNSTARPGETVAVPLGIAESINADNIKVTITPDFGSPVTYLPSDPAIRGLVNLYVDPLSSIVMSRQTNQDLTPNAGFYGFFTETQFTGPDKDWWQTVAFVDLPSVMDPSATVATIEVDDTGLGGTQTEFVDMDVNILNQAGGVPHAFEADLLGPMLPVQIDSLRRVDHFTLNFTGSTVPAAIELDLVHNPDRDNGGDEFAGRAYVVNPIGYIKNVSWRDDGTNMKIILMPVRDGEITTMEDFKVYVAGGITGLKFASSGTTTLVGAQAYDINGSPVGGVNVTID